MTVVQLGEVVQKILGNEDRLTTSREYYVGGEHFVTGDLEIKQFGRIKDEDLGYQFHFPFEPGDVLFMTKNPRLRKASRVNFSGICSIATFVIRTKSEYKLLQDFLPIVMQSDSFWDYLMANQSGSVNPFIKWGTLEKYSFDLPDTSVQKRYCDIIWSLQELINRLQEQQLNLDQLVKSRFIEMFDNNPDYKEWPILSMDQVCEVVTDGSHFSPEDSGEGYPMLSVKDMGESGFDYSDCKHVSQEDYDYLVKNGCKPLAGDVLIAKDGSFFKKGFVVMEEKEQAILSSIAIMRPKKALMNPEYLVKFLLSDKILSTVSSMTSGTALKRVILKKFKSMKVSVPPIELQNEFVSFVHQVDKSKVAFIVLFVVTPL